MKITIGFILFACLYSAMAEASPLRRGDRDLAKKVSICAKTAEGVYVTKTVDKWTTEMAAYAVLGTCPNMCKSLCAEKYKSFTVSGSKCTCTKPKPPPITICQHMSDIRYETHTIPEWTDANDENGDLRGACYTMCLGLCSDYPSYDTTGGHCQCKMGHVGPGPL